MLSKYKNDTDYVASVRVRYVSYSTNENCNYFRLGCNSSKLARLVETVV
jgi:hypothetical protein